MKGATLPHVREALERDPYAFSADPAHDVGLDREFMRTALGRRHEQAVFGAFHFGFFRGLPPGADSAPRSRNPVRALCLNFGEPFASARRSSTPAGGRTRRMPRATRGR